MAKDEAKWTYWIKQIKEWQASGLSRNAYCKREGLKPTTFDYWRPLIVSIHAEAKTLTPPVSSHDITLVPVKVVNSSRPDDAVRDVPREALKLKSPSGWEMQLPVSVDPKWLMALGQLLAVLRQLP
jgi:hypothetical protein